MHTSTKVWLTVFIISALPLVDKAVNWYLEVTGHWGTAVWVAVFAISGVVVFWRGFEYICSQCDVL